VFIDDIARYCDGARDVGMQVIQYEAFEQFQTDISAVLKT
jgi:FMN phosphatase YigB (HAD superfamily)